MLNLKRNYLQLGQTIAEYAILVALVLAAIIAMQVYVKRTLQSRYRGAVRYLTTQMGANSQYEPYYAEANFIVNRQSNQSGTLIGRAIYEQSRDETINRTGTQILLPGCEATEEGCGGI